MPWELAQIAGRAGRFGLVERGHVGVLAGVPWANADPVSSNQRSSHTSSSRGTAGLPDRGRGPNPAAARGSRRRGSARPRRGARRLASRCHARVGARELARRGVAGADPRAARGRAEAARGAPTPSLARGHLEARQRTGRRRLCRAASDACARGCRRHCAAAGAGISARQRAGSATLRSRRPSKRVGSQASCAGSLSSTRASAASRSSGPLRSRRRLRRASSRVSSSRSPTRPFGRCRSCGGTCAPWFPLCDRCFARSR